MTIIDLQSRARTKLKTGFILVVSSAVCAAVGLILSLGTRDVLLSDYFLIPLGLILGIASFLKFVSSYVDYIRLWKRDQIFSPYLVIFSALLLIIMLWLLWLLGYI